MANRRFDQRLARSMGRRATLRLLGGFGAAAALAACGGALPAPTTASRAAAPTPTTQAALPTPASGASPATTSVPTAVPMTATRAVSSSPTAAPATPGGATGAIVIPQTGVQLPTEKVTFRWLDSGLDNRAFFPKFFPAYQQAHPNITVQYDNVTDADLRKLVTAGVQGGNAHDVFRGPGMITGGQMIREGWVAPLDDVIPNFAVWKAAFPPNSFLEGVNVFGGKTYSFPHISAKTYGSLLFYNTDYMTRAGYDPATKPLTWSEFRAAARKITEAGKGQYYGYLLAGGVAARWSIFVSNLARMVAPIAGAGDIDWKTGEYAYTSDPYLAAIDLLLALKADGSVFPGSVTLDQQNAVARMPQGVAGMFLSVTSNIPIYLQDTPFPFNVASQPVPDGGVFVPLSVSPSGTFWWRYAEGKNPQIVADIFAFLGSAAGQSTFQTVTGGGSRLTFPEANDLPTLSPQARRAYALFDDQTRLGPDPAVRNSDVTAVRLERRTVKPSFGEVVQGLYTGQLRDPKKAMQDLKDREDKEQERAIKAAQAKGAKVSRDDWKFPNWDPAKDYTEADYKTLP